jgi:hypothetical protein
MKIRPVGAELFHAGRRENGRTDTSKLTVAFRNFRRRLKSNITVISARVGIRCFAEDLANGFGVSKAERRHLQQQPTNTSAWNVPHCSQTFRSRRTAVDNCN